MLEGISADLIAAAGPVGLLSIAVLLVFLGRLIPRSQHQERIADKDKQIERLDRALETEIERGRVRDDQFAELLEHSRLSVQLLQALETRSREAGR